MIQVCGISVFFFGIGMFASFFITKDITKMIIFVGCMVVSYGLFFRCK